MAQTTIDRPISGSRRQARRPFGVSLIAVLEGIQGVVSLVFGALLFSVFVGVSADRLSLPGVSGLTAGQTTSAVQVISGIAGGGLLVVGVLYLALTWATWTLKAWAYVTTLVLALVSLAISVGYLLFATNADFVTTIADMVIPAVVAVYLILSTSARAAFGRH